MNIKLLAAEITANSEAKGFWHEGVNRNKGEMVMLMVSELGECLESHRKGNRFNPTKPRNNWAWDVVQNNPDAWLNWFSHEVKDSVEDEISDVFIRVLDYIHGWAIPLVEREYRKGSTGNFGNDLLRINHYILCAYHETPGKDWGFVIASIYAFSRWHNINLEEHVTWKMRYNSTRPRMHNKAY